MLKKINETLLDTWEASAEKVKTAFEKISDLSDTGSEMIVEQIKELSSSLPLIESIGFKVEGMSIDLGLPPDIQISFSKTGQVSNEEIQAVIEQQSDQKILVLILKSLSIANKLQSKILLDKFFFAGVSVTLGLPPQVGLKYVRSKETAD